MGDSCITAKVRRTRQNPLRRLRTLDGLARADQVLLACDNVGPPPLTHESMLALPLLNNMLLHQSLYSVQDICTCPLPPVSCVFELCKDDFLQSCASNPASF